LRDSRSIEQEEAAWDAVHEALPARWAVGPATYDPGLLSWSVTARGGYPGRGKAPRTASGAGGSETDALRALDDELRGVPHPDGGRVDELRRRLRLAYVSGAEEWARAELGRGLSEEELEGVLARAPSSK
jgi:hypothetical protein